MLLLMTAACRGAWCSRSVLPRRMRHAHAIAHTVHHPDPALETRADFWTDDQDARQGRRRRSEPQPDAGAPGGAAGQDARQGGRHHI